MLTRSGYHFGYSFMMTRNIFGGHARDGSGYEQLMLRLMFVERAGQVNPKKLLNAMEGIELGKRLS
jgi:hypothetical protein